MLVLTAAFVSNVGRPIARFLSGFRIAARAREIRISLIVMASFALLCLPFIGLMPVIAEVNLGMDSRSPSYGVLYGALGLEAVLGATSVGTVLSGLPAQTIVRTTWPASRCRLPPWPCWVGAVAAVMIGLLVRLRPGPEYGDILWR